MIVGIVCCCCGVVPDFQTSLFWAWEWVRICFNQIPVQGSTAMTVTIGIKGHCAHCDITFELKPWQLNAIAIEEPFDCPYCQRVLQLSCPRQLRQFKALDHWALVHPSMAVLTCVVLIVALVAEWVGLISVIGQLNVSLVVLLVHFLALRYARHRQRITLDLQAVLPALPVEQLTRIARARLGQQ
jgi:hypothetical protein